MKRHVDIMRYLLLAASSEGDFEYHVKLLYNGGLIRDGGLSQKGEAVLRPLRDEAIYEAAKQRCEDVGLSAGLLLNPDFSLELTNSLGGGN